MMRTRPGVQGTPTMGRDYVTPSYGRREGIREPVDLLGDRATLVRPKTDELFRPALVAYRDPTSSST
jgi:hypothetical protein